jgi:hypothetical protein
MLNHLFDGHQWRTRADASPLRDNEACARTRTHINHDPKSHSVTIRQYIIELSGQKEVAFYQHSLAHATTVTESND